MLNLQEVFDKVKTHLLTQNCKSKISKNGGCAYRGENNTKCAAGCLIPDNKYRSAFEGVSFLYLLDENYLTLEELGIEDSLSMIRLIRDLQECHDQCQVEEWEKQLIGIANHFGLISVINLSL